MIYLPTYVRMYLPTCVPFLLIYIPKAGLYGILNNIKSKITWADSNDY